MKQLDICVPSSFGGFETPFQAVAMDAVVS